MWVAMSKMLVPPVDVDVTNTREGSREVSGIAQPTNQIEREVGGC